MRNFQSGARGFTLVELMVALSIVVILTLVAIPSYTFVMKREHRISVRLELTKMSGLLAELALRTSNGMLPDDLELEADQLLPTENPYYDVMIQIIDGGFGYWIVASPKDSMKGDGAQALSHTGSGCWYGSDTPETNEPCVGNENESW